MRRVDVDADAKIARRFRDLVARAPCDLSCSAVLELDQSLRPILFIVPCYTGPDPDPEQLRSLRAAAGLVDDSVRPRSFLAQQHLFNPPYGEDRNYWKSHFVRELPDELLNELLARMFALGRQPGQVLIESLHGAPTTTDSANAAVGFPQAAFNVSAMASWRDAARDAESITWARETAAAVEPWSVSGGYLNYLQADEHGGDGARATGGVAAHGDPRRVDQPRATRRTPAGRRLRRSSGARR